VEAVRRHLQSESWREMSILCGGAQHRVTMVGGHSEIRLGKLHLVDLAGSER
jgi:hypothetical protein